MSSDFFRTRMGQTFYEATMPSLVRELARLNQNLGRLVAHCNTQEHPNAFGVVIANRFQRLASFELRIGG